ncbi:hypothetical protein L902_33020 [Agrobacterium radiobacter DSM 30147]|nr:hypothetical protein L902_33020 [Agrobacterium radiobacter DSM 30147]
MTADGRGPFDQKFEIEKGHGSEFRALFICLRFEGLLAAAPYSSR